MVALTNNHQQNYTSNLSVEALQDVGGTLQDLNQRIDDMITHLLPNHQ